NSRAICSEGELVNYYRVRLALLLALLAFSSLSCNKHEQTSSQADTLGSTTRTEAASANSEKTDADAMGSDLVPLEDISNESVRDAKSSPLVLPTSFGRRSGDLDEMLKDRRIRALVVINPIGFFYSHGQPKGISYEMLEQLQAYVNKKLKTRTFDVKV